MILLCSDMRVVGPTKLHSLDNAYHFYDLAMEGKDKEKELIDMIDSTKVYYNCTISIIQETPLSIACRSNLKDLANNLLMIDNINYNHIDIREETALYWACRNGMINIVSQLLSKPGIKYNTGTLTPLHQACICRRIKIAHMLLDMPDIKFDIKDEISKETAYDIAVKNKMNSVIKKMDMIRLKNIEIDI